ncbi:craniofacial development protein 2-like [Capsicum annuum]|uniref:craniofacial development protein 2-like n=1 Tax=Capsicum annuum TaxID=4072 RepID=UPI0007BF01DB|nr:craniofacial development protein 2-like [Capsicum annuum]
MALTCQHRGQHQSEPIIIVGLTITSNQLQAIAKRCSDDIPTAYFWCSVYAPQVGLDKEVKVIFWEALDKVVRSIPSSEIIFIVGDFNGQIGVLSGGYDDVHRGFGFSNRNGEGDALLDFVRAFGLVVFNLSFSKKEDYLITFQSGVAKTQIDFQLLRKGNKVICNDCKVMPSEYLSTQHRFLVMDLFIKKRKKSRPRKGQPRIK